MRSLVFLALLLGTCMKRGLSSPAYGMMGAMPYGYGYGMGFGGAHHNVMNDPLEPELLNCFASFLTQDGTNVANELAVTIEPQETSTPMAMHGGMGVGMGYGLGFGALNSMHGTGQSSPRRLSARIELTSNLAGGTGFVVITSRARVDDGCSIDNFGDILLPGRSGDGGMGHGMAGHDMGLGMGHGMGYGMGYGMGLGMGYGMGMGMGFGFGMGHDMGSMFDQSGDRGIITEINITPGALTTAVVEDIGFDDLKELAGRGVLVCSDISYDWDWRPRCEGATFSCCNLKYDNQGVGLSDDDDED